MFMKPYAPNRCLYIKRGGVGLVGGSGWMWTKNWSFCENSKKKKCGGSGWGGQGGCDRRIEVFGKIHKKKIFGGGWSGGGGGGGGVGLVGGGQGGCERRIEVFVKILKKKLGGISKSIIARSLKLVSADRGW